MYNLYKNSKIRHKESKKGNNICKIQKIVVTLYVN